MPRSIENIVAAQRIARERIAAGKPSWAMTIDIKPILQRDPGNTTEEHAAETANKIAEILRERLPPGMLDITSDAYDRTIDEIVEGLEAMGPNDYDDDPSYTVLEDLNGRLEELYDWANIERVWLGP